MEYTFTFIEKLVDNLLFYSQAIQKQMYQELEEILTVSIWKNNTHFAQFQGNNVIFTFGGFSSGDIFLLETHPISSDLWRNGNWIIVWSKSSVALWQWVLKRLNNSSVKEFHKFHFMNWYMSAGNLKQQYDNNSGVFVMYNLCCD